MLEDEGGNLPGDLVDAVVREVVAPGRRLDVEIEEVAEALVDDPRHADCGVTPHGGRRGG